MSDYSLEDGSKHEKKNSPKFSKFSAFFQTISIYSTVKEITRSSSESGSQFPTRKIEKNINSGKLNLISPAKEDFEEQFANGIKLIIKCF